MTARAPTQLDTVSFATGLDAHGRAPAVITSDGVLTYAELADRVAIAAEQLGRQRCLVMIAGSNRVDTVVWYLAALAGHHPVLLVSDDDRHGQAMIEAYDPDVVVTDANGIVRRRSQTIHDLHPDLALLLSTSGSTGSPKLVRLSVENLQSNADAIASYLDLTAGDRAVTALPMHYCYGLSVLHSHLAVGASIVLTDLSVVDGCFWELFRRTGVTGLAGVPHTFDLLDRVGFDTFDLPSLRYVTQAGGRLAPETVRRFAQLGRRDGWDLFVMYGQTEATARMAYLPPHLAAAHPDAIGVPIEGGRFTIEPADAVGGADGELIYQGPNVMLGYAEGPADLARGPEVTELRTGDLARVNDAGLFEITGRANRFVKLFGLRIDLDRVERLLTRAGVTAMCTPVTPPGDGSEVLGVLVEPDARSSAPTPDDELAERTRDGAHELLRAELGLPASAISVVAVDQLPRRPNGKLDYATGQEIVIEHATDTRPAPTAQPAHGHDVGTILGELLGVREVTGSDTFVSLGGDSLAYVEVSVVLEQHLGHLPPHWHITPIDELRSIPVADRRLPRLETTLVLRALSILAIVGTHAHLWRITGGAHVLLAVAGFNFGRFQLPARRHWPAIARIAVPSMAWIAIAALTTSGHWGPAHALLVNSVVGDADARFSFWFVETLVALLVVLALALRVPRVRRLATDHPFGVAVAVAAVGLAIRHDVIGLPAQHHHWYRPQEVLWIFAAGWAAAHAESVRARLLVTALVAAGVHDFFGDPARELTILLAVAAFVWLPVVPVPRTVQRLAALLAGASLYIYLVHWPVLVHLDGNPPVLDVVVSLVAGVAAWRVSESARARVASRRVNDASGSATTSTRAERDLEPGRR